MSTGPAATLQVAAHVLGLPIEDAQTERLLAYLALLQRWNTTYNLTSVRDPTAMLTQHLVDCLAVVEPLRRHAQGAPLRVLDVGSGGGLPGAVIAVMTSGADVTCVDSVGKKAAFVRQVSGELRLKNLHAEHARVEQLNCEPFDVIVSRAFASLRDFVCLSSQLLREDGAWMAMKGKTPVDELTAVASVANVFHVEQLKVPGLDAERCLIWMRRL